MTTSQRAEASAQVDEAPPQIPASDISMHTDHIDPHIDPVNQWQAVGTGFDEEDWTIDHPEYISSSLRQRVEARLTKEDIMTRVLEDQNFIDNLANRVSKVKQRGQLQEQRQQHPTMPTRPLQLWQRILVWIMVFFWLGLFFIEPVFQFQWPYIHFHNKLSLSTNNPIDQIKVASMSTAEQTFIAIKPDGVQRGLVGPIISRFENRGFKLVAIKLVTPGKEHLEKHYADLKEKPFFPGLVEYMNSGPIVAMVWEGLDAVKTGRVLLGATNPLASAPGTIRGDFSLQTGRNVIHGSDSVENAKKEIALWFAPTELVSWKSAQHDWVYEA